jgi:hypothetical protein
VEALDRHLRNKKKSEKNEGVKKLGRLLTVGTMDLDWYSRTPPTLVYISFSIYKIEREKKR